MRLGFRELIFLIVLLAVPIASYVYVFKPRNVEIQQANSEIETKRERLNRFQEVAVHLQDLGRAIDEGKDAIETIEEKLPSEDDVAGILGQFTQLAKANQLSVPSFKPTNAVPAASYMEMPIEMTMTGRFNNFYEFLLALEQLPRITRVHQLEMEQQGIQVGSNSIDENAAPGSMKAEFTLSIYYTSDEMLPE